MNVYGVRWGLLNVLGFTIGGIQWVESTSAPGSGASREQNPRVAAGPGHAVTSGESQLRGGRPRALIQSFGEEHSQATYDLRGRRLIMALDARGLMVDIWA